MSLKDRAKQFHTEAAHLEEVARLKRRIGSLMQDLDSVTHDRDIEKQYRERAEHDAKIMHRILEAVTNPAFQKQTVSHDTRRRLRLTQYGRYTGIDKPLLLTNWSSTGLDEEVRKQVQEVIDEIRENIEKRRKANNGNRA
jgi:hypothetical protein